jgi:hypothetical protein
MRGSGWDMICTLLNKRIHDAWRDGGLVVLPSLLGFSLGQNIAQRGVLVVRAWVLSLCVPFSSLVSEGDTVFVSHMY